MDIEKCIACGTCAEKCPKKVDDSYNEGLSKRKAIYVKYSQAVPLKYGIDKENCIYFQKGKCKACEKFCPAGAILFDDKEREITLEVGSIILAPGFKSFDPKLYDTYSYVRLPNVVTSLEFERILSATGPFMGHLLRPSDRKEPEKIAWLQCVGSRDINRCDNGYCSSVCCMYAIKQAIIAREHSKRPLDCAIFFMDMRTHGKDFDRYYENARSQGIRFIRSRIHSIEPYSKDNGLLLSYIEEDGTFRQESFDMVVLSVGLEIDKRVVELSKRLGIELNRYNFVRTDIFSPVCTSVPGIYACGAFTGPKDIPQSVMEASAAACAASAGLSTVRNTKTRELKIPEEKDVSGEEPRIGVFVCNCGINIGGVVRVPEVVEYAKTLPHVVYVEENLFTCSQDTQEKISEVIKEKGLNRVVVAACTPRTHEALFQETLTNAGLNKYLFEMANIRNQCSWVHSDDPDAATQKAKDLVKMAVAKAALLTPLKETELKVTQSALVIGGGIAGMCAALSFAKQGYDVHLVERSNRLGGNALKLHKSFNGQEIRPFVEDLIKELEDNSKVRIHLNSKLIKVEGFVGNFRTDILQGDKREIIEHGVTLIATGAREYKGEEYLYGKHKDVITQLEMDELIRTNDSRLMEARNIVFIQCVGSRDENNPYCSKVCCSHSIRNALDLKEINPDLNIYILYRDIRTYGIREDLYREARRKGVLFFRYDLDEKPKVESDSNGITVYFKDRVLQREIRLRTDILCLATAIVPNDNREIVQMFKVSMDLDGWLLEAHQKLRPVEFATDGVFLCGMAHYPKPIEESIAQAQAAVSRAITVLSKENILVGGVVSEIDPELCSGCLGCLNVCPFKAIDFDEERNVAVVNKALCKGCGACAATCPSQAPRLMGFNNPQIYAQIKNALS